MSLADPSVAQPPITVPDGFEVECVYRVPEAQGSWVVIADAGPRGLVTSDQYGKLYEVALSNEASPRVSVQPLDVGVGSAQGLLVAFNSLYIMVNDRTHSGLYRCQDADGDGRWDAAKLLLSIPGDGEHGPHAVIVSPDRQALLICAGNHTKLPALTGSRVPQVWAEDLLLDRLWDPQGHATGLMAPGGWICRVAPDGSTCKLVSIGYRNQYDIALNADGELFTYDADMEWDAGTAWYRPTRILHVTSGSDFGWRGGTAKWPTYYPDSLPAVVELGPGSPTGLTFGSGTTFPARYQQALFAADWSFGRIHAVHLLEQGSSYVGESEVFASAAAMPVTDMVVRRSDGALYFTTGGRRLQSALYRVTYPGHVGTQSDVDASGSDVAGGDVSGSDVAGGAVAGGAVAGGDTMRRETEGIRLRTLRDELEQLHDTSDAEVEIDVVSQALPFLSHADRHIRYAARTAIELQPTDAWLRGAVPEDVNGRIEFAIAAARHATPDQAPAVLRQLAAIDFESITCEQKLGLLRAYGLASVRLKNELIQVAIAERFSRYFPSGERPLDRELCRVLAHAGAPGIVENTLKALRAQSSLDDRTHYLFALSTVQEGWSPAQRRMYFEQLAAARSRGGGKSFGGYIDAMARRSIRQMPASARPEFLLLTDKMARNDDAPIVLESAEFVREWMLKEVLQLVAKNDALDNRDLQNGRRAFTKANCFACHQIGDEGGVQGPSLTTIGARFSPADIVVTIVDPSREVSDQYAQQIFELADGRIVVGRVVNLSGDEWYLSTDMMNPGYLEHVTISDVESMERSPASPMPAGLLNVLDEDETLDLLAYLVSLRGH